MRRPIETSAGLAALLLCACPALPERIGEPSAARRAVEPPGSPAADSLVVITVRWPERGALAIPPQTDRIAFEASGSFQTLPTIPELLRPTGGTLTRSTSARMLAVPDARIRATAFGAGPVVAQSQWTPMNLKRNARVDLQVELLPAKGADAATAKPLYPQIDAVVPDRGYSGRTTVVIAGKDFGYSQTLGSVSFGGEDAGVAQSWNDSDQGGATISLQVPANAKTGPLMVRVGGPNSDRVGTWPKAGGPQTAWSTGFSVLGAVGDPILIDSGRILDHLLAFTQRQFWAIWTRDGGAGVQLLAMRLTPVPDLATGLASVGKTNATSIATAKGIKLGGAVADGSGIWMVWQEVADTGSTLKLARIPDLGTMVPPTTLPATPATDAQPVIARSRGTGEPMMVAWVDIGDTRAGCVPRARIYTQALTKDGDLATPSANPAQQSNGPKECPVISTSLSAVGTPSIASSGTTFLAGWQEALMNISGAPSSFNLVFQEMAAAGHRADGPTAWRDDPAYTQKKISVVGRSLEDPHLVWSDADKEYLVAYQSRIGGPSGTASDIFVHRLDRSGQGIVGVRETQVADDARLKLGQAKCPSGDAGLPCGQGLRRSPRLAWNLRDYMITWEMVRDDGEVDVLGARIARDPAGLLARAVEEPKPRGMTAPESLAEIIFTGQPAAPYGNVLPGTQGVPRLVWGRDVLLVGWIERSVDQNRLIIRLWR